MTSRLRKIELSVGPHFPACAGRPELPGIIFQFDGRTTDGHGNDIDPAWLEPCPRCGRTGCGKLISGVDPDAVLGVRVVHGIDPGRL